MNTKIAILLLSIFSLSLVVQAQNGKVLQQQEITEAALIDALTPSNAPARTRSIRVTENDSPGGVPSSPSAAAPSASLMITFETNSAQLTQRAMRSLDVVGQALSSNKLAASRFSIEGHADPRGGSDANLQLSQARAESVRQYLVKNSRIADGRLDAVGKGDRELMNKSNPIAPENRRVTIVNLTQ
jgi:outer membrane protein OmpA-like peptidoglycan-associated protein